MKIRKDFVSNSSSSSYIISSDLTVDNMTKKMFRFSYGRNKLDKERREWANENGQILAKFLKTHTCLTIFGFNFSHPLTAAMKKKFYMGHPIPNTLFCGHCCPDEYLDKYFDKEGNIKTSAKPEPIMNALTWYRITDKGKLIFNHEDVGYVRGKSGKITKQSIRFNRWMIESIVKRYEGIEIQRKDSILRALDALEKDIEKGNWYYLNINHDGDGVDEDSAYYSNYSRDGEGNLFSSEETYLDLLTNEGIVNEISWVDSM